MGHESRIEPWLPMTTVLLVSFRTDWLRREDTMKTAWKETGNRWAAVFSIRMDGAAGQNRTCSSTWGWKQEKFQRWGKCFLLTSPSIEHPPRRKRRGLLRPLGLFSRDGFGGFLPQPPYFSGGPRRGFTFGLPAHRSFGQKKYGAVRKEKKEGPYILGLKTPRLYGHPVNDWASNPWEPAVTLPCRSAPATPSRARQQVAFPARTSPERKIVS